MKRLSVQALEMIADRFRILAEPLRLRILHVLRDGELSVNALTDKLETSQPNVSKHLGLLQSAGIVRREKRGNNVYYSISDESIFELCEVVCDSLGERLAVQARTLGT